MYIYIYIIAERVLIGIENNVNVCSEKKNLALYEPILLVISRDP